MACSMFIRQTIARSARSWTTSSARHSVLAAFQSALSTASQEDGDKATPARRRPRGRPRKDAPSASAAPSPTSQDEPSAPSRKKRQTSPSSSSSSSASRTRSPSFDPQLVRALCSAVAKGDAFEHRTLHLLRTTFVMPALERTGGAGDRGIDLTGWWHLPLPSPSPASDPSGVRLGSRPGAMMRIRVVVQCKYVSPSASPLGPIYIRELEGTLYRKIVEADLFGPFTSPSATTSEQGAEEVEGKGQSGQNSPGPDRVPLLGILSSSIGFSSACARYALASPLPLLLLHIPHPHPRPRPHHGGNARDKQGPTASSTNSMPIPFAALPNPAFIARTGLLQGRLELRPTRRVAPTSLIHDDPLSDARDEKAMDGLDIVMGRQGTGKREGNGKGRGNETTPPPPLDPALTIHSPELLLDGLPLRPPPSS